MQTVKLTESVFPQDWYRGVERIVLGSNKFNEEQKNFIQFLESSVIEAGPGSGKTTALSAKVALLIRKMEEERSSEGICIITHTNAAVNEILNVLKKLGYKGIPHPHFIGTIHQFFNNFGMFPLLIANDYDIKEFQFTEKTALKRNIKNELQKKKQHGWLNNSKFKGTANRIMNRLIESHLYIDANGQLDAVTLSRGSFYKYKDDYLKYKKRAWKEGEFGFNDTFCLAQEYFNYDSVRKRLKNRFKYLLMDEYQDVTPLALELLENVFLDGDNILQLIGDGNQHIAYNNPEVLTDSFTSYHLNQTNRFGDNITKVLNKMFDNDLKAVDSEKSFKPIIFLYKNPDKLLYNFEDILKNSQLQVESDENAISVVKKDYSKHLKQGISKSKEQKLNTKFQESLRKTYQLLSKKGNLHYQLVVTSLNRELLSYHLDINKQLLNFFRGFENKRLIKDSINSLLKYLGKSTINISNNYFKELENLKGEYSSTAANTLNTIPIKTIHDLKGQTLKANMVYLGKESDEEYAFLETYTNLLEQPQGYSYINKRVTYVAMSRPSTLLVMALHKETYDGLSEHDKEEIKRDFKIISE